jgi:NitT/TauT family transport system ATP-binding protein
VNGLDIQNLWLRYGATPVLERIELHVPAGELVTIVGASGCGKTSFLRLLLGELAPTRGQILFDGRPLPAEPGRDRGVVFQRYSVFPHLTVLGNVLLGLELDRARFTAHIFGRPRRVALSRARAMLAAVGLDEHEDKYPAALSGGMRQRLALAQALVMEPPMLLLDEPFGALDPGTRADMHALLTALWQRLGLTVFMVTHDLHEGFALGTRLLVFDKPRWDPQDPTAYGATITYDLPLRAPDAAAAPELGAALASALGPRRTRSAFDPHP